MQNDTVTISIEAGASIFVAIENFNLVDSIVNDVGWRYKQIAHLENTYTKEAIYSDNIYLRTDYDIMCSTSKTKATVCTLKERYKNNSFSC